MPLALQASAIFLHIAFIAAGSTDDWGTDTPQQENGLSAWIWSPQVRRLITPEGSIRMSAVNVVILSDGGQASITPPFYKRKKLKN